MKTMLDGIISDAYELPDFDLLCYQDFLNSMDEEHNPSVFHFGSGIYTEFAWSMDRIRSPEFLSPKFRVPTPPFGFGSCISTEPNAWSMYRIRSPKFLRVPTPLFGFELETLEADTWVIRKISSHEYYSNRLLNTKPMEDRITRRMMLNTSCHSHPYTDHTSNDSNLNRAIHKGAAEEPYDDNQIKGRVEHIGDTIIYIVDHPSLATAKISPIVRNQLFDNSIYGIIGINFALTAQAAFTVTGISNSSNRNYVGAITVVGFIGSLSAMLLWYRLPKVARYLGKVSIIMGVAAVVGVYAANIHPEITLPWGLIYGIAILIPSVALLFAE